MQDLYINEYGDIEFEDFDTNKNTLKISFFKSKNKALKVSFDNLSFSDYRRSANCINVSFYTSNKNGIQKPKEVSDRDYLIQQINMSLKTTIGELPLRKDIGSTLEVMNHIDISDNKNILDIKKVLYNSIKRLLPNCEIDINVLSSNNNNYYPVLEARIKEDTNVFSYELELN